MKKRLRTAPDSRNSGKDSKTIGRSFGYNELDTLADLIVEQAAEGWELSSKSGNILGFRRAKCRRIKVSCEVIEPDYDPYKTEYIAFCQAAGWRHIFSDGNLQIFETEDLDAEPIHTDPMVKLQTVHHKCLFDNIVPSILWIVFALLLMWRFCWNPDYDRYLSGQYEIGLFLGPLCILVSLINIGRYFLWYAGARRTASGGGQPVYRKNPKVEKAAKLFSCFYVIAVVLLCGYVMWAYEASNVILLWFLLVAAVGLALIFWLQRRDARRGTGGKASYLKYGVLCVVILAVWMTGIVAIIKTDRLYSSGGVSDDRLQISMEDLGIETTGQADRERERDGLLFLHHESGSDLSQNEKGYELFYDIFTTKDPSIYEKVLNQRYFRFFEDGETVTKLSAETFGAREVWLRQPSEQSFQTWLFLWDDRIVSVEVNFDLSKAQQALLAEKLRPDNL